MSDYKPGTVAVATVRGVPNVRVFSYQSVVSEECFWDSATPVNDMIEHDAAHVSEVRPLVVLDPDDREQMDALCKALVEAAYAHGNKPVAHNGIHPDTLVDALRSLTKPPKPPEPQGLGAVVEDTEGVLWTRASNVSEQNWRDENDNHFGSSYSAIDVVRVLSDGWEPKP